MRSVNASQRSKAQWLGLLLGPLLFFGVYAFDLDPAKPAVRPMAAVAVLMATWWITDAIPLAATALLPVVLYPLLGIMAGKKIAPVYINSTIFLFVGGFLIALTMQRWALHKRIALWIIRLVGGGPQRMLLGFMLAAAFLSMWISNTATAIMMVPIGMAIILRMEQDFGAAKVRKIAVGLMLGIAYACSAGGIATLVGTPPNLSFARIFAITFPQAPTISFGRWLLLGLPLAALLLAVIWLLLSRLFMRDSRGVQVDPAIVRKEYRALGPMSYEERVVLAVFVMTALLWVFRKDLVLGAITVPGWSRWLAHPKLIDDGTVALLMALVLFVVPTRSKDAKSPTVLNHEVIGELPWNIVLLFGGGFALAQGFRVSGLSNLIGNQFAGLVSFPPLIIIVAICFTLTFLTELTSNTATTEMILPILAAVAVAMKVNPLMLMVPATISASCAFMMPVATPPNAIVFGSKRITIAEMARVGLLINLVGVLLITAVFYLLGTRVLGIDLRVFPAWATHQQTTAEPDPS